MEQGKSKIVENKNLAPGIFKMTLETSDLKFSRPGQFAMVRIKDKFLRRPISVASYDSDRYELVYRVVGEGTHSLSTLEPGLRLECLTGLGNGYDLDAIPDGAYIIGGGIGIPPLYGLLRFLAMQGKSCKAILGFVSAREAFMVDMFKALTDDVIVVTEDGSMGEKGFVTDVFDEIDYACSCGPLLMLRALDSKVKAGQFSLEARMGCGFGACMGCSILTKEGPMRVCKEGPVFDKEVLAWENL